MHFHDLRHTSATLAIAKGEPLKVTQERLGRASPATTLAMYGQPRRRCTARRPTGAEGCWAPGISRPRLGGGTGGADEHYGEFMGRDA